MEGSNGTFKSPYVPFSREGTQPEAERGEAPKEPMTVQITYEKDAKECYICHKNTHLLFWFSSTYSQRLSQGCARRLGGRVWEAVEKFMSGKIQKIENSW